MSRIMGCALAMFIGICVAIIAVSLSAYLSGRFSINFREEAPLFITWAVQIALPFAALALIKARDWQSWVIGILLTAVFWGALILDPFLRDGGGANIGLGLVMIVSPFIIFVVCLAVSSAGKNYR